MTNKVKDLVVDSGAFLRNSSLHELGENIYTCSEVVAEIKSKWAKDRLQVLPYEIKIKEPEDEDLQFVTKFARKTGDFFSLSNTDLKVIALAVRIEREKNAGKIDHLKKDPSTIQIISNQPTKKNETKTKADEFGFNFKNKLKNQLTRRNSGKPDKEKLIENDAETNVDLVTEVNNEFNKVLNENNEEDGESKDYDLSDEDSVNSSYKEDDYQSDFNDYYYDLIKTKDDLKEKQNENENSEDDEGDWITPLNIEQVKKQFDSLKLDEKMLNIEIDTACITGDFSMQNVLMQIGIKVLSVEKGLLIRQTRQFVLRCIACFSITNNTGSMFCPSCGNLKTLKKVSVSVDENGQKRIHLNPKKPVTTRDVKLRIPRPRKGKYALNPILVADQHVPKFRQAKFAIQERKLVNESILSDIGYLVRDSPFSINDVYSRSSNYRTGNRAAAINKMVFNEGRKYETKKKKRGRN